MNGVILDFASVLPHQLEVAGLYELPINWTVFDSTSPEQITERITEADLILVNKVVLNAAQLQTAQQLKYIGVMATGTNNIDTHFCAQHNIQVHNAVGYGTETVCQHALALLLTLANRITLNHKAAYQGTWHNSDQFCVLQHHPIELCGKTLVIVGYGELGKRFASLANALGMKVIVAARPGEKSLNRPDFDEVLPEADVVSLHCLLSEQTQAMMNKTRFQKMKSSAILINTARGGLIDEAALLWALDRDQIGGAGLDVLCEEPPQRDNVLLQNQRHNLLITPHCAWGSIEARQRLFNQTLENIKTALFRS
ncbi:D-2-hydroxyacid dehydrogenase [Alteromonas sediminis]|uniref:D-2-hydroxyacid dehydrogenase n=1 Tax=Alteromonas sediminis TaxID=2259342 RepID=A0A3N5Y7G7_9ALTE|nr:D-2-hydroxyacid dehydrogenase [Alteromonas sediminis]RPJ66729.1 D-2-hydroxyacid dehydrogenase [Alteromonas sediminis]